MRAFLALAFPDAIKASYAEDRREWSRLFPGLRWVRPECLHLTLCFFGEIDESTAAALRPGVARVVTDFDACRFSFGGAGSFGPRRAPRVYWFAVDDGAAALERLHPKIGTACRDVGLGRHDDRRGQPWTPHVTVARARQPAAGARRREPVSADEWRDAAERSRLKSESFLMRGLTLMSSELTPDGPIYTPVWSESSET